MNCKRLPTGYHQTERLDFVRDRRLLKIIAFASLGIIAVMVLIGVFVSPPGEFWGLVKAKPWVLAIAVALMLVYIPLHEVTHGICMRVLSGERTKYGFSLCYAYAGSLVFFDRNEHIFIALAPVVLWGIVLGIAGAVLPREWFWITYMTQITNISGAVGDFYCSAHLACLPKDTLIQDTGTRMRIFAPKPKVVE